MSEHMDNAYAQYKEGMNKEIAELPSVRSDFDTCSPKYIRKTLKYMPKTKPAQEKYIGEMLNICTITKATAVQAIKETKTKRKMSGWNCYLRMCAQEPNMTFPKCMKDEPRKKKLYFGQKELWNDLAGKACPITKVTEKNIDEI
ncbi:MAG: hypothetical protein GY870_12450 [archaeon]|nr:hypothetical protein [archaeon]